MFAVVKQKCIDTFAWCKQSNGGGGRGVRVRPVFGVSLV